MRRGSTITHAASTKSWREERRVPGERVPEQALVVAHAPVLPLHRLLGDRELELLTQHAFSGSLAARADGDRDVRRQPETHVVAPRSGFGLSEHHLRRLAELHSNLRAVLFEALSGAHVERDSVPTPGVDAQAEGA